LCSFGTVFDYDNKRKQISEIETRMAASGFWDNQERAQETVGRLKSLRSVLGPLEELIAAVGDLEALMELAEGDESAAAEVASEVERLEHSVEELELRALLDGPHDDHGAILSINARDGGTDAADWAEMLLRMYCQWAQKNDYTVALLDRNDNEEAGISNATIAVRGPMAYGYLKGETGMHRLVRISPFNAEGKRQTSFAAVDVSPEVSDDIDIDVAEKDVREDVFRASGAGGQHVNKTSSAIRLTHLPTGIVVQCQNDRSQHKNRAEAMKMLKGKLYMMEQQKRDAELAKLYSSKGQIAWGNQIRSYVLQPYQLIKDHRTDHQSGQVDAVLDGEIEDFIESYLRYRAEKKHKQQETVKAK